MKSYNPVTKLTKEVFKNEATTMSNIILDRLGNRVKIMRDIRRTRDGWELEIVDQILLRTPNLDVLNNRIDDNIRMEKYFEKLAFEKGKNTAAFVKGIHKILGKCPKFKDRYEIFLREILKEGNYENK